MLKIIITFLFLSSCSSVAPFRIALPEKFYTSQVIANSNLLPKVFIAKTNEKDIYKIFDQNKKEILGNQFVFGLFPLTNLYLEHGLQSFYLEALIQHFLSQGVVPILVSKDDSRLLNCDYVEVSPESYLNINAYDLFATRVVKVSALMKLNISNNYLQNVKIAHYDFYRQAHFPLLASFIQAQTSKALSENDFQKYIRFCNSTKLENAMVLNFPKISTELSEGFLDLFKYQRFNKSMLARLIQRGAESALEKNSDYRIMSVLAGSLDARKRLDIELRKIETTKEGLVRLFLRYNLTLNAQSASQDCVVEQKVDLSRDSAELISIEQAIDFSVRQFLSGQCAQ